MPVICIASPKGGVGKTTIASNLLRELSRHGWRTVGLDLDPQNALRLEMGVAVADGRGFLGHAVRKPAWRDCLLDVAPKCQVLPYGAVRAEGALEVARQIAHDPEWLVQQVGQMAADPQLCTVIDTEPGPSAALSAILPTIDIMVSVLITDALSAVQLPVIEAGHAYGPMSLGPAETGRPAYLYVLNQHDPRSRLSTAVLDPFRERVGNRLLGVIHRDENVAEAAASQTALLDYAPAAQASLDLRRIVDRLEERLRQGWRAAPQGSAGIGRAVGRRAARMIGRVGRQSGGYAGQATTTHGPARI